jgi:hypothetical protein
MSFREKSAWAMAAVMALTGLFYLRLAVAVPADAPPVAQLGPLVPYVLAVSFASIVVQIALAVFNLRDANKPADERERQAIHRAGHSAGIVLAVVVVSAAGFFLVQGNGARLFQWVIGGLIISQFADYALQVYFFRRSV